LTSERVRRSGVSPQGVTEHTAVVVRDDRLGVERGALGDGRTGWGTGDRAPRERVDRPDGGDLPGGLPRGRKGGVCGVVDEDHHGDVSVGDGSASTRERSRAAGRYRRPLLPG